LDAKDLVPKLSFNKFMKFKKIFRNLRLVMKQIDPSEFAIIIYKADIILFPTKGINGRSHTSKKTSSKGPLDLLDDTEYGSW
jgi:hypothetical protein